MSKQWEGYEAVVLGESAAFLVINTDHLDGVACVLHRTVGGLSIVIGDGGEIEWCARDSSRQYDDIVGASSGFDDLLWCAEAWFKARQDRGRTMRVHGVKDAHNQFTKACSGRLEVCGEGKVRAMVGNVTSSGAYLELLGGDQRVGMKLTPASVDEFLAALLAAKAIMEDGDA